MHRNGFLSTLTLASLSLILTACDSPPRGDTGGRVGVSETTASEAESRQVLPSALIEFSDQLPQRLIQDLQNVPRLAEVPGQATIILGDIKNETRIVGSGDFQVVARRIRNNLLNSPFARDEMKFVERRGRMMDIAQRESVATDGRIARPADYDPEESFTLLGNFFRISRGDTNYYYMNFELVHFGTNEIVFSDRYEVKQVALDND